MPNDFLLPLFATNVLHAGPVGFGLLSSAFGLGALFSALWIAWGNHKPSIRFLLIAAFVFCMLEIAFACTHVPLFSFPLIASVGFAQIVLSATANTTLQMVTPNHLHGRVMSVYLMVFAGGLALLFGAPISLLIGGFLSLIAAFVGWVVRKPAEQSLAASTVAG